MNRSEVSKLLALAAARDRRKVGEVDVAAWLTDLDDLDYRESAEALGRHYRESTDYLMPAHIRRQVREIHAERDRYRHSDALALPSAYETDADRAERVKRGMELIRPILEAIADRSTAMTADADPIRERALSRARREHGRPERPTAAPRRTPRGRQRPDYPPPVNGEVQALALAYLRDGYSPAEVSERLAVSRDWCARVAHREVSR